MKKDVFLYILIVFLLIIIAVFLFRFSGARELDDITPGIPCESSLMQKSDVLWVIPLFDNKSIAENKTWCKEILSLNKTIGMHGVYHKYKELDINRDKEYIKLGMTEFEKCFGFKPKIFKPSHLAINRHNKKLIANEGMILKGEINQRLHKVYHCNDTGRFSNWFISTF